MTTLREAAQQAIEALEYYRSGEDYQPTPASEAITALRAALEQQTRTVAHGHEWKVLVCGVDCHPGGPLCNGYCTGKTDDPPAAKDARWVQEP